MTDKKDGVGIRISSDPDTTSMQAIKQGTRRAKVQPFRLLLVSNLTPEAKAEDWSGSTRLRTVDKNNFDQLIADLAPTLTVDVPNKISAEPKLIELSMRFESLNDFRPSALAAQVPALATLVDVRSLVARVQAGEIDAEAFRDQLAETGVDPDWAAKLYGTLTTERRPTSDTDAQRKREEPEDPTLSRLFDMVDTGGDSQDEQPKSSGLMDALAGAVSDEPAGPRVEKPAAELLTSDLDEVIGAQLNAILNEPAVRELEAAWRGLKFLVDRFDFRAGVTLELLLARMEDLSEALYHQVLLPEHKRTTGASLSGIVLDYAFDNSSASVGLLSDVAETAASLQIPVIASAGSSFFGVASLTGLVRLPLLRQLFEGPDYIHWRKFREQEEAKNLTLAVPSFPLRFSYGSQNPATDFVFKEEGQLWGGGALLVAVAMADSYKRTGWPTHLAGCEINDLPVWKGDAGSVALRAVLSDAKLREMGDTGFTAFGCKPNDDKAFVATASTTWRPGTYETEEATVEGKIHATLPCQLFVSSAAHFLLSLQNEMDASPSVEDAEAEVMSRCLSFLGIKEPADIVEVSHIEGAGSEGHEAIAVRLRPPKAVIDYPVSLALGVRVPVSSN